MPPRIQYSKEAIIDAGFAIARRDGLEAVNARAIAAKLGCSTQPLFREFQTMEQIKAAILAQAWAYYQRYTLDAMKAADKPYKASGMAYLRFAKEETPLFKALFMRDRGAEAAVRDGNDPAARLAVETLARNTGMTPERAGLFHLFIWMFVHGMASMIATNSAVFSEEEIEGLISGAYHALVEGFAAEERGKES